MSWATPCQTCGHPIPWEPADLTVHAYWYQPWFAWCEIRCPLCKLSSSWWFGPQNWERWCEFYTEHGASFIVEDFPDDDVVAEFISKHELSTLQPRELTQREERRVEFFAWLLQRALIDEELRDG